MTDLTGKAGLVTGSGSGIGRESARALAREGASVVVSDVNVAGGRETVELITAAGGTATFVEADVTDMGQVCELVGAVVDTYGTLDFAHNNAGIGGPLQPILGYSEEDFDRILTVNVKGVFHCLKAELAVMVERGAGAIVNTCSTFGLVGMPSTLGYVASKHAVAGLTRATALDYARQGVRVNAVCPGAIDTPMVERMALEMSPDDPKAVQAALAETEPMGRLGRPEEIGAAVAWLCSDAASFVTGTTMTVDGGWTAQ